MKHIIIAIAVLAGGAVFAHSGRTNSEGCHNNRKTGDYHCHGGGSSRTSRSSTSSTPKSKPMPVRTPTPIPPGGARPDAGTPETGNFDL